MLDGKVAVEVAPDLETVSELVRKQADPIKTRP